MSCDSGAYVSRLSAVSPLLACLLFVVGCGGYGEVSPTAYEYAKALYSLANRQAADRLDEVELQIDTALEAGEITDYEAGWLRDILEDARNEDWNAAQKAARRIMDDQVSMRPNFGRPHCHTHAG